MDKHEPSTIKHRRYWSGIKAADGIMAAFSKRNAQLLQPHNPRERICTQRLKTTPSAKADTPPKRGMAFTLAEVLITLSIIGVVATLTIPTLIQRTGDEETVSRLTKSYAVLSQASEAIINSNGSPKTWLTDVDAFFDLYKEHLRGAKICGTGTGCFYSGEYKYLNNDEPVVLDTVNNNLRSMILPDGAAIRFYKPGGNCTGNNNWGTIDRCGEIVVDINGKKAPNTIGRDTFMFNLTETGLVPAGCDVEDWCDKTKSGWAGMGYGCTCRVITEGAMNY